MPALGGRLLAVRFGGAELVWRNPALLSDALRPVGGHRRAGSLREAVALDSAQVGSVARRTVRPTSP